MTSTFLRLGLTSAINTQLLDECVHCIENSGDTQYCTAALVAEMFIQNLPNQKDLHEGLQNLKLAVTAKNIIINSIENGGETVPIRFANAIVSPQEIEPIETVQNTIT